MTRYTTRMTVALTGILIIVVATSLPLQPVFGEGAARRDVVRQEEKNVMDAIRHAKEAVDHGKQGHAEVLVTHAEASLQHAKMGGTDPHLDEAITHLQEAIEHGKAGHVDVATQHAENALTHLDKAK